MPNFSTDPIVKLSGVFQRYRHSDVLRGVDLSVSAGEVLAIIGPSGSGKSTLLRVINHLVPITSGSIEVDGIHVEKPSKADLRRLHQIVGMVFQNYNLFPHMTALRNVTLALTEVLRLPASEAQSRARKLLGKVRLADKEASYPDELSGGQQQRVAIARSLAINPKVMLLDEVTAALDPETVKEVLYTIKELAEDGMTLLIVTHEMSFAREVASRLIFMDEGIIVEEGLPSDVLSSPKHQRTKSFVDKIL